MRAVASSSKTAVAIVFALCAASVRAAEESPIPGLSVCAFTCTADAAIAKGCTSYLNVECVCKSQEFQLAAGQCLMTNCTEVELKTAMVYQAAVCTPSGAASGSSSATAAPASSESASSKTPGDSAASIQYSAWGLAAVIAGVALIGA